MDEVKVIECRVCLKIVNSNYISLFETYKNKLVHEHISSLADVTITSGDGLPDNVCEACLTDLDNCLRFRYTCESSARLLYIRTLQLQDVDIKEEPDEIKIYSPKHSPSSIVDVKLEIKLENNVVIPSPVKGSSPECHDCGKCFKSKPELGIHWRNVHDSKSRYVCPYCKKILKTSRDYNKHKTGGSRNACTIFIAGSKDFRKDIHIKGEGKSRIYCCSHCNYNSKTLWHVKTHLFKHNGVKSYKCDICEKAYTQLSTLLSHKQSVHTVHLIECHICRKTFNGKRRLHMHVSQTHKKEEVLCKICNKQFKSKGSLQRHLVRHSGVRSFTCEICASCFFTSSELSNHLKTHSLNIERKTYQCDICHYCTKAKYLLSKHIKLHTSGERRPFSCQKCALLFKTQEKLATHEQKHYEHNLFPCPVCNKYLSYRRSLLKHVSTQHNMNISQRKRRKNNSNKNPH